MPMQQMRLSLLPHQSLIDIDSFGTTVIDVVDRANKGAGGCLWVDEHFDTPVGDAPRESSQLQLRAFDSVTANAAAAAAAELRYSMPIQASHDCFAAYRAYRRAVAPTTTVRSRSKQDPNAADVIVVVVAVVAKALK